MLLKPRQPREPEIKPPRSEKVAWQYRMFAADDVVRLIELDGAQSYVKLLEVLDEGAHVTITFEPTEKPIRGIYVSGVISLGVK